MLPFRAVDEYPSSWRVFLVACWDMLRMLALPIAAVAVLVAILVGWPGPMFGLAILLVVAWLCDRGAERLKKDHHW